MTEFEKNILCVEDNTDNQVLFSFYVKNQPYNITYASNAKEAIRLLDAASYDLFLVDLNLPDELTGLDVVKNIRSRNQFKKTPVVVITAFTKNDIPENMESYIDQYITKPVRKADFLNILETRTGM